MAEIKYTIKIPPITKKNSQQIMTNRKTGRPFIMLSAKYKQYEREAAWFLKSRPPRPIDCPVNIKCLFYLPTWRRTDLTNLLEAVDDLLVSEGIIEDVTMGSSQHTTAAGAIGTRKAQGQKSLSQRCLPVGKMELF